MPHRNNLPIAEGMLQRQRVSALIQRGLQQPLLVMLAGPGWGKTQAISAYLQESPARVLWLRLNQLDDVQAHFWAHFVQALSAEFPELSRQVQTLEFPDTAAKRYAFLHLLVKNLDEKQQAIWVFDDFGSIGDPVVLAFFGTLVQAELENFHVVLIANTVKNIESVAFLAQKHAPILMKDLRFTQEELSELFSLHGTVLEAEEREEMLHITEGWPLPLHLLAMQHGKVSDLILPGGKLANNAITHLMESYFYKQPAPIQTLTIALSLLNSFTMDFAAAIYDGDKAELALLQHSPFLVPEPSTGRESFHNLYNAFLQTKQYRLSEAEKRRVWAAAGAYFRDTGDYLDAIVYCRKAGDHVGMLEVMRAFVIGEQGVNTLGITPEDARFFLAHLELLTPEEERAYPIATYFRALVYLNTMELDKAEGLYRALEQRLRARGGAEDLALLGEVYAMWGALRMMMNKEDFGECYRKASEYLPQGVRLQNPARLHTHDSHSFSMADNQPGALARMERAVHEAIPWASAVLNGGMSGLEHLYSAEAAYLTGRFDEASPHAYRALYKAEAHAQYDLVCNSYFLLGRLGLMQGQYAEMKKQIDNVADYAKKHGMGVLKDIRDTALGWYYVTLEDYAKAPKSLLTQGQSGRPIPSYGRAVIVYATYLLNTGEYAKMVGMLENPVGLYLARGIWPDRVALLILLAAGYGHLGNEQAAMEALWTAYDLTYHNGITTPFVKEGAQVQRLLALVRRQDRYEFDPAWLEEMDGACALAMLRKEKVLADYRRGHPEKAVQDNPLTKREMEVLQALALGQTREEIAVRQSISINTVKAFIRSIYHKLDAANRAEAVSTARARGYIDMPSAR